MARTAFETSLPRVAQVDEACRGRRDAVGPGARGFRFDRPILLEADPVPRLAI
jgi:hypothetical protein